MTTRSTDLNYVDISARGFPYAYIGTADTYYKGSLVAHKPSTGHAILWTATAGEPFLGLVETQSTAAAALTPGTLVEVTHGAWLKRVAVTGASAVTDVGVLVYAADDDSATMTLTPTILAGAVGRVRRWYSSTTCDVQLFTPEQYVAREKRATFTLSYLAATFADGDMATTWTPGFAGRIVDLDAVNTAAVTTGAKASTLNLEIGTTNITGGTIALSGAYTLGAVVAGAAITAANHFSATDTISLEAASTTTFAEGSFDVVVQYVAD